MSPTRFRPASVVAESHIDYLAVAQKELWVEALVDCPGAQGLFTYSLPMGLEVRPGDILTVPFGSQQVGAIAVRLITQLPLDLDLEQLRPVEEVISTGFLPKLLDAAAARCPVLPYALNSGNPGGFTARSAAAIAAPDSPCLSRAAYRDDGSEPSSSAVTGTPPVQSHRRLHLEVFAGAG